MLFASIFAAACKKIGSISLALCPLAMSLVCRSLVVWTESLIFEFFCQYVPSKPVIRLFVKPGVCAECAGYSKIS